MLRDFLKNLNEDAQIISIGIFDRDDAGMKALNEINYPAKQDDDWKVSMQRKAGCFTLPIPSGRQEYADNKNLCIEYYFDDETVASKNADGRGLSFSIYLDRKEVPVEDDPALGEKYPESRKIKDDGGKMVFAREIVPTLQVTAFENFKPVFEKVLKLIGTIEESYE